jgi:hypothetical protein
MAKESSSDARGLKHRDDIRDDIRDKSRTPRLLPTTPISLLRIYTYYSGTPIRLLCLFLTHTDLVKRYRNDISAQQQMQVGIGVGRCLRARQDKGSLSQRCVCHTAPCSQAVWWSVDPARTRHGCRKCCRHVSCSLMPSCLVFSAPLLLLLSWSIKAWSMETRSIPQTGDMKHSLDRALPHIALTRLSHTALWLCSVDLAQVFDTRA